MDFFLLNRRLHPKTKKPRGICVNLCVLYISLGRREWKEDVQNWAASDLNTLLHAENPLRLQAFRPAVYSRRQCQCVIILE